MTTAEILTLIAENDKVAVNALLSLYARQTADEQAAGMTAHDNGVGFSGADAEILTSFAEQVIAWKNTPENARRFNTPLSDKQMALLRKKLAKYGRQLTEIAAEKAAAKAAPAEVEPNGWQAQPDLVAEMEQAMPAPDRAALTSQAVQMADGVRVFLNSVGVEVKALELYNSIIDTAMLAIARQPAPAPLKAGELDLSPLAAAAAREESGASADPRCYCLDIPGPEETLCSHCDAEESQPGTVYPPAPIFKVKAVVQEGANIRFARPEELDQPNPLAGKMPKARRVEPLPACAADPFTHIPAAHVAG